MLVADAPCLAIGHSGDNRAQGCVGPRLPQPFDFDHCLQCAVGSVCSLFNAACNAAVAHTQRPMLLLCPQGSYGTVRVCTQKDSGKQYAVKIISKRKGSEDRTEVIQREVEMWGMLSGNQHIAELAGVFQDNNNMFIVQVRCRMVWPYHVRCQLL